MEFIEVAFSRLSVNGTIAGKHGGATSSFFSIRPRSSPTSFLIVPTDREPGTGYHGGSVGLFSHCPKLTFQLERGLRSVRLLPWESRRDYVHRRNVAQINPWCVVDFSSDQSFTNFTYMFFFFLIILGMHADSGNPRAGLHLP